MILWNGKYKKAQAENSADWSQIYRLSVVIIAVVLVVTAFNFTPGSVHIFNRSRPAHFCWTILRVITAFYKCVVVLLTKLKRAMMHVTNHISFITIFFSSVFVAVFPWYSWTATETSKTEASWKWPKESFSTHGKKCGVTHGNGAFLWRYVIKLYILCIKLKVPRYRNDFLLSAKSEGRRTVRFRIGNDTVRKRNIICPVQNTGIRCQYSKGFDRICIYNDALLVAKEL